LLVGIISAITAGIALFWFCSISGDSSCSRYIS
jgi:hypothetical protein